MTPRTNELSENTQPGVFLAVLAVLIAYTLGGIDVPPNTRTCTQETRRTQFGVFCYQYSFPNQVTLHFLSDVAFQIGYVPKSVFKP